MTSRRPCPAAALFFLLSAAAGCASEGGGADERRVTSPSPGAGRAPPALRRAFDGLSDDRDVLERYGYGATVMHWAARTEEGRLVRERMAEAAGDATRFILVVAVGIDSGYDPRDETVVKFDPAADGGRWLDSIRAPFFLLLYEAGDGRGLGYVTNADHAYASLYPAGGYEGVHGGFWAPRGGPTARPKETYAAALREFRQAAAHCSGRFTMLPGGWSSDGAMFARVCRGDRDGFETVAAVNVGEENVDLTGDRRLVRSVWPRIYYGPTFKSARWDEPARRANGTREPGGT